MTLAEKLVQAATPHLGIAARDVLRQSCRGMIGVDLEALPPDRVESLIYWVRVKAQRLMPADRAERLAEALLQAATSEGGQSSPRRRESVR
ncbi:MAG: hypothetical protein AB2A00_18520 [Myxococcota bacterium]